MLKIEHLDVSYSDVQVLWGVGLEVKKGEMVALVGSNGAGKTTLIRTIAGLLRPASGAITFNGNPLNSLPPHKIAEMGISMIPEGRRLFSKMTVLQNLEMGAFLKPARLEKDKTLSWIYDIFPVLKQRSRQSADSLSGGEQQMLAIGRALMARSSLLLLDEMSLGLSPLLVKNMFEVILEINRAGYSVLIVEQNVPMTLKVADRAYIIETGRITAEGPAKSLLDSPHVKEAYLGLSSL